MACTPPPPFAGKRGVWPFYTTEYTQWRKLWREYKQCQRRERGEATAGERGENVILGTLDLAADAVSIYFSGKAIPGSLFRTERYQDDDRSENSSGTEESGEGGGGAGNRPATTHEPEPLGFWAALLTLILEGPPWR